MKSTVNALLVAILALSTAQTNAVYVSYDFFNASDCNPSSLVATGILAGDGSCLLGGPLGTGPTEDTKASSRLVTCSGITNFPVSTECKNVPIESRPDIVPTRTDLGKCLPARTGATDEFIRFSCRLGGHVRVRQSTANNCTLLNGPNAVRAESFYFNDRCTNGFRDENHALDFSSNRMTVISPTIVMKEVWDNVRDCAGPASAATNHTLNTCVDYTDGTGGSEEYDLTGSAAGLRSTFALGVTALVILFSMF